MVGWLKKTKEQKRFFKVIAVVSYALKMGVTTVTCVCSLFQVIKHISTGLHVYLLTSTCAPNKCDWQKCYPEYGLAHSVFVCACARMRVHASCM